MSRLKQHCTSSVRLTVKSGASMNKPNDKMTRILYIVICIDLAIAIPYSLTMLFLGAIFGDGKGESSLLMGILVGIFTFVVLTIPAMICYIIIRRRKSSQQGWSK